MKTIETIERIDGKGIMLPVYEVKEAGKAPVPPATLAMRHCRSPEPLHRIVLRTLICQAKKQLGAEDSQGTSYNTKGHVR